MQEQKIEILKGLEHIRTRPGMYIGDTSTPKTLLKELIDNALDELINNYASRVEIDYSEDGEWYRVRDNGRGLPLYEVPDFENQVAAKLLFTELFSGGKFSDQNYVLRCGLHGIGLSIVGAMSSKTYVTVNREEKSYNFTIQKGEVTSEIWGESEDEWWTTEIKMFPDPEMFDSVVTSPDMTQLALAMNTSEGLSISVNGESVQSFNFQRDFFDDPLVGESFFSTTWKSGTCTINVHYGWTNRNLNTFCRGAVNLSTCNYGLHERNAKTAITKAISGYSDLLRANDCGYGLRYFVNVFTADPSFTSQIKERLSSMGEIKGRDAVPELTKAVEKTLNKPENEDFLNLLVKHFESTKKKLENLSEREFVRSKVRTGSDKRSMAGIGISECTTKNREEAELYLCEGESAASAIRRLRDQKNQAVLSLRGKPMNTVAQDSLIEVFNNKEIVSIVNSIGAGVHPDVVLEDAKYGKVIIAADADHDGKQICNLLLGALVLLIPELVEAGKVYELVTPIFKQGDKYYYSENEKGLNLKKPAERFKGLGSMSDEEVFETILDTKTRKIRQIELNDRKEILDIMQFSSEKKSILKSAGVIVEDV